MKARFLLVYGYLIPFVVSAVISATPWLFGFTKYDLIGHYLSENIEMIFALLAIVGAALWPFLSSILNENDPHVIAVLKKSKARNVFVDSAIVQTTTIILMAIIIVILSTIKEKNAFFGFLSLFSLLMIMLESLAVISNWRSYGAIRETIIDETNKAIQQKNKQTPR